MRPRFIATTLFVRSVLPLPTSLTHPHYLRHGPTTATTSSSSFFATAMMSTSASSSSTTAANGDVVRVVSYNLLSSKLARPSHFTHAKPGHLEFERRLPLICAKLDEAMNRVSLGDESSSYSSSSSSSSSSPPPPTIFALQEVCYPFASALHTFFAERGYHFVTGLYGRPFNGYMGVGIAYPLKDFKTINVDICRLSDERPGGWPREKIEEEDGSGDSKGIGQIFQKFSRTFESIAAQTIKTINNRIVKRLGYTSERVIDPWKMSENRFNVLLTVVLRSSKGKSPSTFSISNYHMPCAFFAPAVMNIHSEMAARRVQDIAAKPWKTSQGTKRIPHIFAGDFNILPDSPHYKLLTTGTLDRSDPTYPPEKHGVEWKVESLPMDSAYAMSNASGTEPEFTNYAHVKDDPDPFIGTLDYIFVSQKEQTSSSDDGGKGSGEWWKVHDVQKLPGKDDSGGPFPNKKEPSDHFLIAADLELMSK